MAVSGRGSEFPVRRPGISGVCNGGIARSSELVKAGGGVYLVKSFNVGTFLRIVNDKQKRNVFTPECVHPGDGCFFVQRFHHPKSPLQ